LQYITYSIIAVHCRLAPARIPAASGATHAGWIIVSEKFQAIASLGVTMRKRRQPRTRQPTLEGLISAEQEFEEQKRSLQPSFFDRRIRDSLEYARFKDYIWQNPVKRFLVRTPEEYPYSSAIPFLSWIRYLSG
jgi:hypothetical protein